MSTLLEQASLVLIPSGYKEDVVYSQIPTDGSGDLSFSRASNGTRINSAGLVEVCPWNLVQYSEQFDDSYWFKQNGSSVTSNSTTAPNGTTTADTLNVTTTSYSSLYNTTSLGLPLGQYTQSVYAKKGTKNWLYILDLGGSGAKAWFNLDTGVVGTVSSGYTATMQSVGDGWYRCILTETANRSPIYFQFGASDADNSFTPSSSGTVFVWGAQLNIGSTAKPYFPTTDRLNVPRLTYQNGGGGCPSLLLEKQSTNLQYYSQQFDLWSNASDLTVSANATTSPDGTQNADKLNENSSNGYHIIGDSNFNSTAGTTYTMSFFAKASERSYARILAPASSYNTDYAYFDLTNGSVSVSSGTASMQSMGNGWYRCVWSLAAVSTSGGIGMWIGPARNMTDAYNTYTGTSGSGIFVYGAQLEASNYVTSYIPSTSSSATRVADACFKTGISSLIGQTQGTILWDLQVDQLLSSENILNIDNGSFGDTIYFLKSTAGSIIIDVWASGVQQSVLSYSLPSIGRYKIAFAYANNDFALYINGVARGTDSSGSVPPTSRLQMGQGALGSSDGKVNELALFKTRLTNAELASLTTI